MYAPYPTEVTAGLIGENQPSESIREGRVPMMGTIRQELLSGIRQEERFHKLRNYLRALASRGLTLRIMSKRRACTTCAGRGESQDRRLIS